MPKKPGFTLEQHEALGLELQIIRDRLSTIHTELTSAYPRKVSDMAWPPVAAVDDLRA